MLYVGTPRGDCYPDYCEEYEMLKAREEEPKAIFPPESLDFEQVSRILTALN